MIPERDRIRKKAKEGLRAALKDLEGQAHLRPGGSDEQLLAFSKEMFAHIAEYRKVFQAMVGKPSGILVQQLLHKIVMDLVRNDIRAVAGRRGGDLVRAEAVIQFLTRGFFGLAMLWAAGRSCMDHEMGNLLDLGETREQASTKEDGRR
jgi:hypothetical protein